MLSQQWHPINITSYQVIFLPISWGCCISRLNRRKQIVESRPKSKRTQSLRLYRTRCQGKLSVRWVFHKCQCLEGLVTKGNYDWGEFCSTVNSLEIVYLALILYLWSGQASKILSSWNRSKCLNNYNIITFAIIRKFNNIYIYKISNCVNYSWRDLAPVKRNLYYFHLEKLIKWAD